MNKAENLAQRLTNSGNLHHLPTLEELAAMGMVIESRELP
jgi:hypothetical protein